jgi:hypothetical protein
MARNACSSEQAQGFTNDGHLCFRVTCGAQRCAVREMHVQRPRDTDVLRNVLVHNHGDRRDAFRFDRPCYQSNGLLADRSTRGQKGSVDAA